MLCILIGGGGGGAETTGRGGVRMRRLEAPSGDGDEA